MVLGDRLDAAVGQLSRHKGSVAVLFVDADRFKSVNDSLGHRAGDELLRAMATRLSGLLRPSDTVVRYGGDEFVAVCRDIDGDSGAVRLCERVRAKLAEPYSIAGREVRVTVSLGVAVTDQVHTSSESLLRDADTAMYRAKERGRNRTELFDERMRSRQASRDQIEDELRRASSQGELAVHYQPVLDLGGAVVSVEALARWNRRGEGWVPPSEFLPVAEQAGLITSLGVDMLAEAARQVARWRIEHPSLADLGLSVNLTGHQLVDPELPRSILDILADARLPADRLELEITEAVIVERGERAVSGVRALRDIGARVTIDDFGTGYSSLLHLRRLPVTALKLDRFFVAGVADDHGDARLAAAVINLAHSLGLGALAKGVETIAQVGALRAMGCDLAQGFYWSEALPAAEVLPALLGQGRADQHAAAAPRAGRQPAAQPAAGCLRVVLADDSEDLRCLLRLDLEDVGDFCVVAEARDGAETIQVLERTTADVVVLDLAMPGTDGLEVLSAINSRWPDTDVVVLSGFLSDGIVRTAIARGATECVEKVFPGERLVRVLRHVAESRRRRADATVVGT
jgi:diguanylate cyclase (GGDEF)-like protein